MLRHGLFSMSLYSHLPIPPISPSSTPSPPSRPPPLPTHSYVYHLSLSPPSCPLLLYFPLLFIFIFCFTIYFTFVLFSRPPSSLKPRISLSLCRLLYPSSLLPLIILIFHYILPLLHLFSILPSHSLPLFISHYSFFYHVPFFSSPSFSPISSSI